MKVHQLTPILNVSDIKESFEWFEKLGWQKAWDWGTPPTFGGVCCDQNEIFLCEGGQGGRGHTGLPMTFGPESDEALERDARAPSRRPRVPRQPRHRKEK